MCIDSNTTFKKVHLYFVSCCIFDIGNACMDDFVIDRKVTYMFKENTGLHGLMYRRHPRSCSYHEGYISIEELAIPLIM